ncbi:hypothetical protein [Lysinibacillus fusiformis]|uniref:hypothetical protein n=1 Tax=Lysinibacillus fusiformis TaxID=28031 RepID=UPI003D0720C7
MGSALILGSLISFEGIQHPYMTKWLANETSLVLWLSGLVLLGLSVGLFLLIKKDKKIRKDE